MVFQFYALLTLTLTPTNSLENDNFPFLPGLDRTVYSQPGDIKIGSIVNILGSSLTHPAETCSNDVAKSTYPVESSEAVAFAVDLVNRSPYILPNVSLGFVIRPTCLNALGVTLGNSLSFLPRTQRLYNNSTCCTFEERWPDSTWLIHDVIGVVGVGWSSHSIPVSSLYAVGHLPMIGPIETSDDLSNKMNHPYFFRVIPPDTYQIQAILKFIYTNGWSYISVIYNDGSYGQNSFDKLQKNAHKYGICVATSHRLIHPPKYDDIVSDLLLNYRARVVVLFIAPSSFIEILQTVQNKEATGHFIWVASDTMISYLGHEYRGVDNDLAIGTFTFDIYASSVPSFYDYLQQQNVSTSRNPWMKPVWEYLFDCSHEKGNCGLSTNILQSAKYHPITETTLRIDAVLTFARAAHELLSKRCPDARGEEARACISGDLFREFLKNSSFEGFNGRIKFDENQDVKGKYMISQLVHDNFNKYPFLTNYTNMIVEKSLQRRNIGVYNIATDTLNYLNETVSWSHLNSLENSTLWNENFDHSEVPQSICSISCGMGEYKIEKELPCCWECRKCRKNEHLVKDNTTCETCPSFMWPDPASGFTTCIDIPLTYPLFKDPIPIVFTSLAIIALGITILVIASYTIYRNERVIKASSRELSVIQLFAIFTGYITVILFQIKPSDTMCSVIFFLFCMSFVLLYSPLLIKTVRICRIFRNSDKNQQLRFISPFSQIVFATSLIIFQASLCITVYILYRPRAKRTQPIWSEKLVELSCDLTFPGIASFLGYNIVLVSMCSVFAFIARALPDNFNESKFISMCVSTTLLIWLAFIPAYFTADREFVRAFLLSVALYLNHSVALILLFVPKIYAARFMPPETGKFSSNKA